jgi:polysaccharide deacetylase 2 family uncharacterized protein YibQ
MLNKLTKIKILLVLMLFVGLILKRDTIKDYFFTSHENSSNHAVKVFNIGEKEQGNIKNIAVAKLAIIISDLGLLNNVLDKALHTNPKINLGISIYSENLTKILKESSDHYKHDSMVLLPTQSSNYSSNDPGPYAMLIDSSISDNSRKFHDIISKLLSNKIGIYLSPLSAFSFKEDKAMSLVQLLEKNANQFRFFMYYDRDHSNILTKLLSISHILDKTIIIDKIIDYNDDINASLDDLKNTAIIKNSVAIAIISSQLNTIEALENWIQKNADTIELLSVSDILKTREKKK